MLTPNTLFKQFVHFFSSYSLPFNKVYLHRSSLFNKNIKRKQLVLESYFRILELYIHLNPVEHGFISQNEYGSGLHLISLPPSSRSFLPIYLKTYTYNKLHSCRQKNFKKTDK